MAAVVLVVATLVGVKLARGSGGGLPRQPAPTAAVAALTPVPLSALRGAATRVSGLEPAQATSGPPLMAGAKPELLFISAEFCPICATERWPMVVALSQFGTFTSLSQTHSALSDGDISTLSFYGSTFTSPYLSFVPVETTTNQPSGGYYRTLETPTSSEMAIWAAAEGQQLAFPFLDIGGNRCWRPPSTPTRPWKATASPTSPSRSATAATLSGRRRLRGRADQGHLCRDWPATRDHLPRGSRDFRSERVHPGCVVTGEVANIAQCPSSDQAVAPTAVSAHHTTATGAKLRVLPFAAGQRRVATPAPMATDRGSGAVCTGILGGGIPHFRALHVVSVAELPCWRR